MSEKTPDSAPEQAPEEDGLKAGPPHTVMPQNAVVQPLVATYADIVTCTRLKHVEYLTFYQPIVPPPTTGERTPLLPVAQIVLTAKTSEALARILAAHNGLEIADSEDTPEETE